jgi:hypothetical protein
VIGQGEYKVQDIGTPVIISLNNRMSVKLFWLKHNELLSPSMPTNPRRHTPQVFATVVHDILWYSVQFGELEQSIDLANAIDKETAPHIASVLPNDVSSNRLIYESMLSFLALNPVLSTTITDVFNVVSASLLSYTTKIRFM